MQSLIQIIELHSGETLYEYTIDQMDQAYEMATLLENNGVEVQINSPSLIKTLIKSLGVEGEAEKEYEESVHQELSGHCGVEDCEHQEN